MLLCAVNHRAVEMGLILIAECARPYLVKWKQKHDMTFSYSYDVNSAVEASDQ
jgi:hypothetical protein